MKIHYVYRIDDPITMEFYIGSRTCECSIETDTYMGSMVSWTPEDKDRLVKSIIKSDFNSREEAIEFEALLITENIKNPLNKNCHIPSKGFYSKERNTTHPFINKKLMHQFCKKHGIMCNTNDGSDVDWDLIFDERGNYRRIIPPSEHPYKCNIIIEKPTFILAMHRPDGY